MEKRLIRGSEEWIEDKINGYWKAIPEEYRERVKSISYACGITFLVSLKDPYVNYNSWKEIDSDIPFTRKDTLTRFVATSFDINKPFLLGN